MIRNPPLSPQQPTPRDPKPITAMASNLQAFLTPNATGVTVDRDVVGE